MKVLYRNAPLKKKVLKANYSSYIGVVIDGDLSFKEYVASLCKKASRKLSALYELSNLMHFQKRKKNNKDYNSSFNDLLKKNKSICIQHKTFCH